SSRVRRVRVSVRRRPRGGAEARDRPFGDHLESVPDPIPIRRRPFAVETSVTRTPGSALLTASPHPPGDQSTLVPATFARTCARPPRRIVTGAGPPVSWFVYAMIASARLSGDQLSDCGTAALTRYAPVPSCRAIQTPACVT